MHKKQRIKNKIQKKLCMEPPQKQNSDYMLHSKKGRKSTLADKKKRLR